jgi:hypothetical protein
MSEGGELMHFRDWRCHTGSQGRDAPGRLALPLQRAGGGACLDWACHPGAAGPARHPSAPGGSPWRRSSAPVVDLPNHQGDLQCRARVGEVFCGFL